LTPTGIKYVLFKDDKSCAVIELLLSVTLSVKSFVNAFLKFVSYYAFIDPKTIIDEEEIGIPNYPAII
jgi:hypothetical protein